MPRTLNPHDPSTWYSAAVAARLSGHTLTMVNYLCRSGLIEPSCTCPRGYGLPRHYSFGDVVALRLTVKLAKSGVSPLRLKRALIGLRRYHPEITLTSLPASHIVTDGRDLYLRQGTTKLERAFDGQGAFAFVIELAQIQREVAMGLGRSRRARIPARSAA